MQALLPLRGAPSIAKQRLTKCLSGSRSNPLVRGRAEPGPAGYSPLPLTTVPCWCADDEKTKAKKKKLQKSYKSKLRFQRMDVAQKQKADAWKSFMTGKGAAGPVLPIGSARQIGGSPWIWAAGPHSWQVAHGKAVDT